MVVVQKNKKPRPLFDRSRLFKYTKSLENFRLTFYNKTEASANSRTALAIPAGSKPHS